MDDKTQRAIERMVEELLERGIPLENAEQVAPRLVELFEDPRGPRAAFIEKEPTIALHLGLCRRH